MKIILILLSCLLIASCANNQINSISPLNPILENGSSKILMNTDCFGFGVEDGVMQERESDVAFKDLITKPNATKQFKYIFEKGNIYSKLYALCALHHLDQKLFKELTQKINQDKIIWTQNGCCVDELTVKKVISEIKSGRYDYIIQEINKKDAEQNVPLDDNCK